MNSTVIQALFYASQILCAAFALYYQQDQINSDSTKGLSTSLFVCSGLFALMNAGLSYKIWKPFQKRNLTSAEKEARAGCVVYGASASLYTYIFLECARKRFFQEHIDIFNQQDLFTIALFGGSILGLYLVAKSFGSENVFGNARIVGVVGFFAVVIPHTNAGLHLLRAGIHGVSRASLWLSICMIICKIVYYGYIRFQSRKNKDEAEKAEGVLIAEFGNILSSVFILWCFYQIFNYTT